MIEREEDARLAQPCRHLVHVAAKRLQLAVQPLVESVDAEVDLDVAVGQPARHFLGDEEVPRGRIAVEVLETPANRVVIGDGHQVHAAGFRDAIDILRPGIAVAALQEPQVSLLQGVA